MYVQLFLSKNEIYNKKKMYNLSLYKKKNEYASLFEEFFLLKILNWLHENLIDIKS